MVHTDLNTKVKGTEIPNNRLKPDGNDYDPIALLEYNLKTHRYTTKDENLAETLLILGINQQFVVDERRRYISDYLADLDLFGLDDMVIDCFFTAIMLIEKEREP